MVQVVGTERHLQPLLPFNGFIDAFLAGALLGRPAFKQARR